MRVLAFEAFDEVGELRVMARDWPRSWRGLGASASKPPRAIAQRPIQQGIHRNRSAFGIGNVVVAGGNLLGAAREFAAGQGFEHQRRNQAVAKQGEFFGFGIHRGISLSQKHTAEGRRRLHANAVWGPSGGRRHRAERGADARRERETRASPTGGAQVGKQEAVSGDPADGLRACARPCVTKFEPAGGSGQRRQRRAQALGLLFESGESRTGRAGTAWRVARPPGRRLRECSRAAGGR